MTKSDNPERLTLDEFSTAAFLRYQPDTVIAVGRGHREEDGKTTPRWFAAIEVGESENSLPSIRHRLTDGSVGYYMLNGLDRSVHHRYGGKRASFCPIRQGERGKEEFLRLQDTALPHYDPSKRFPYFHASDDHVKELGFLWMDFDVGRPDELSDEKPWADMMAGELIGKIFARSCSLSEFSDGDRSGWKLFPWPTYVSRSGRGVTALWYLVDEGGGGAARASAENMHRWYIAEQNLFARTKAWGADPDALNPARWLKMPGSKVAKVDPRETPEGLLEVDYVLFAPGGHIQAYTLTDFMRFFGVSSEHFKPWSKVTAAMYADGIRKLHSGEPTAFPVPDRVGQTNGLRRGRERNTRGEPEARWRVLMSELLRIAEGRKIIRKGGRRSEFVQYLYQASYTYHIQTWAREAPPEISDSDLSMFANREAFSAVQRFNERHCRPMLSRDELREAVDGAAVFQHSNRYMSKRLLVTRDEAEALGLKSLLPPEMIDEQKRQEKEEERRREWRRCSADEMLRQRRPVSEIVRETGYSRRAVYKRRSMLMDAGGLEAG